MRHFSTTQYPADFEESPVSSPNKGARTDLLADDLDGEANWDLDNFLRGPELSTRASICIDYRSLRKVCSVVCEGGV